MAKIVKIRVANDDYPVLKSMADAARLDAETFAGFMMRRLIDMLATDINFSPAFFQYGVSLEVRDTLDAQDTAQTGEFELSYALAKQVDSAYALESTYGALALDEELLKAVKSSIKPILARRLAEIRSGRR